MCEEKPLAAAIRIAFRATNGTGRLLSETKPGIFPYFLLIFPRLDPDADHRSELRISRSPADTVVLVLKWISITVTHC